MYRPNLVVVIAPIVEIELRDIPQSLTMLLSDEELVRGAAIQVKEKQLEFIFGRALLRAVLSKITNSTPSRLDICLERSGRPYLNGSGLDFSLSHAAGFVCVAISETNKVGVDIESLALLDTSRVLNDFLRGKILNKYASVSSVTSFDIAGIWCMHEAYAKCSGKDVLSSIKASEFFQSVVCSSSNWYCGSQYSIFRTAIADGNIPLAICVDSHPFPFDIVGVDLFDANFLNGVQVGERCSSFVKGWQR